MDNNRLADLEKQLKDLSDLVTNFRVKRITQDQITPGVIRQIHASDLLIKTGKASARPTSGNSACKAYFATDTNVLSIWTGTAWKATTLA